MIFPLKIWCEVFIKFHFSRQYSWRNGKWSNRTRTTRRTSRLLPHLIINLSHNSRHSHFLDSRWNFSRRVLSSKTRTCSGIVVTNWTRWDEASRTLCERHWCSAQTSPDQPDHVVITVMLLYLCFFTTLRTTWSTKIKQIQLLWESQNSLHLRWQT